MEIQDSQVTPTALAELLDLQEAGTISGKTAKDVFEQVFTSGASPKSVVEEQGLAQIESGDEVTAAVENAINSNEKAAQDYRGGKEEAIKFLVGQVMKETRGRARPDVAEELLRKKLGERA
jgi:aspartyl-tRNA(Asn)/glutamyl-tRNA(Gln) amidotransferase subunit B